MVKFIKSTAGLLFIFSIHATANYGPCDTSNLSDDKEIQFELIKDKPENEKSDEEKLVGIDKLAYGKNRLYRCPENDNLICVEIIKAATDQFGYRNFHGFVLEIEVSTGKVAGMKNLNLSLSQNGNLVKGEENARYLRDSRRLTLGEKKFPAKLRKTIHPDTGPKLTFLEWITKETEYEKSRYPKNNETKPEEKNPYVKKLEQFEKSPTLSLWQFEANNPKIEPYIMFERYTQIKPKSFLGNLFIDAANNTKAKSTKDAFASVPSHQNAGTKGLFASAVQIAREIMKCNPVTPPPGEKTPVLNDGKATGGG